RDLIYNTLDKLNDLTEEPRVQATLMNALGRVSLGVGQVELADSLHRQALAIQRARLAPDHPDTGESLLRLGSVASRRGDFDRADSLMRASREVRPDHVPTLNALGYFYASHNRLEASIPIFQQISALDPEYIPAIQNLGAMYYYLERWDEALEQFE